MPDKQPTWNQYLKAMMYSVPFGIMTGFSFNKDVVKRLQQSPNFHPIEKLYWQDVIDLQGEACFLFLIGFYFAKRTIERYYDKRERALRQEVIETEVNQTSGADQQSSHHNQLSLLSCAQGVWDRVTGSLGYDSTFFNRPQGQSEQANPSVRVGHKKRRRKEQKKQNKAMNDIEPNTNNTSVLGCCCRPR